MATLFAPLSTSFLGFDSFFSDIDRLLNASHSLQQGPGFPPQNLYKEVDGGYCIEMALAGFKKADIKIEFDQNSRVLTIVGDNTPSVTPEAHVVGEQSENRSVVSQEFSRTTLRQGIAARKFSRSFTIAEGLFIDTASMEDGLLTIKLSKPPTSESVYNIPIR